MASQKGGRRSRKARSGRAPSRPAPRPAPSGAGSASATGRRRSDDSSPSAAAPAAAAKIAPRVGPRPTRRQLREERERAAAREQSLAHRTLGTYGERPPSIFEPVPVSELAILLGLIAVVVGLIDDGGLALAIGGVICALGVLEFSAREHFSGYRSHGTLLAAFPAVGIEVVLGLTAGVPRQRELVLAPALPVFALAFWALRRTFARARHARVTQRPTT